MKETPGPVVPSLEANRKGSGKAYFNISQKATGSNVSPTVTFYMPPEQGFFCFRLAASQVSSFDWQLLTYGFDFNCNKKLVSFIYFEREREREHVRKLGRSREKERQNPKQAPQHQCRSLQGVRTHEL